MSRRAVIYCRMSRDREGGGLGVDRQRADCQALAERLDWQVISVHQDNDISAYSGKPRPGYRALLEDLRHGRADAVIAWHTDRLHRSPRELEEYVDVCEAAGVVTHTVKAGPLDLSTPSGRMVARQLGAVARFEVEHSIERARRAKLQAATAGRWKGGRRPFGFAADGITIEPAEAVAIAAGADALLAGVSLYGLTRQWNEAGLRTSTGGQWHAREVRRAMLRPRNAGLMEHRGEVIGRAEWPAILPEDRWRAVVSLLTDPARRTSPGPQRRWLGSGLYRCGVCGQPLIASTSGKTTGRGMVPAYRCTSRQHVTRNAEHLDNYVGGLVVARLRRPDAADLLTVDTGSGSQLEALHGEAVELRRRLDGLADLYATGSIDARQLAQGSERLRGELLRIEATIGAIGQQSALGVFTGRDPGDVWDALDLDRRRAVVDALMTVTVNVGRRGRLPGGVYFDAEAVDVDWRCT